MREIKYGSLPNFPHHVKKSCGSQLHETTLKNIFLFKSLTVHLVSKPCNFKRTQCFLK